MKIAHLILAHTDPIHIARLAEKLAAFSDVFIHVDSNENIEEYENRIKNYSNIFFLKERIHCGWETWNAVQATLNLMKFAMEKEKYDRLTFLQGLDYPLKSNKQLKDFYEENKEVEFIRACCISDEKIYYLKSKCGQYYFRNGSNFWQDKISKFQSKTKLCLRPRYVREDKKYKIYWGSAQWSLTGTCVEYILKFNKMHPGFNKWFYYSFPVDEMYFATIIHNSEFAKRTRFGGSEPGKEKLVNWRNLHYFEYPDQIRFFEEQDFDFLIKLDELYVRKTNTEKSTELLDKIDNYHEKIDNK